MTLVGFLDCVAEYTTILFVLLLIVDLAGYEQAERRAATVAREWAWRGEDVPEELEVPRSLIPAQWRRVLLWATIAAPVIGISAMIAESIVK